MKKTTSYYIFAYAILLVNYQMLFVAINSPRLSLATDQSALLTLKAHITLDPYGILTRNWTNSSSVCSWIGVTCGSRHYRVVALNISNMGLIGTIPPQLGNLSFLGSLSLRYNLFSGTLPQELSQLQRLKHISLTFNNFSGDIPSWFGLLPKLEHLTLEKNNFTGFIPKSLSNLSNLELLAFSYNSLQGNIPDEFRSLRSLQVLTVQYNHLSGPIPPVIFNLSNLKVTALTSNKLSGSLPFDLCASLPFLEGIYLSTNQLTGLFPSNLSKCSKLQHLSLKDNFISGQIPREIGMLKSLQYLYLEGNNLDGIIHTLIAGNFNLNNLLLYCGKKKVPQ